MAAGQERPPCSLRLSKSHSVQPLSVAQTARLSAGTGSLDLFRVLLTPPPALLRPRPPLPRQREGLGGQLRLRPLPAVGACSALLPGALLPNFWGTSEVPATTTHLVRPSIHPSTHSSICPEIRHGLCPPPLQPYPFQLLLQDQHPQNTVLLNPCLPAKASSRQVSSLTHFLSSSSEMLEPRCTYSPPPFLPFPSRCPGPCEEVPGCLTVCSPCLLHPSTPPSFSIILFLHP